MSIDLAISVFKGFHNMLPPAQGHTLPDDRLSETPYQIGPWIVLSDHHACASLNSHMLHTTVIFNQSNRKSPPRPKNLQTNMI